MMYEFATIYCPWTFSQRAFVYYSIYPCSLPKVRISWPNPIHLRNPTACSKRMSQMKKLNIFSPYFIEHKRYTMASFFYVVSTVHCAAVSFNVTWRFSFHSGFHCCNGPGVSTGCTWPARGESVTELMPFMNFLVHSYTCCSDRHTYHTELSFVDEFQWVSHLHYSKNGWQNAVLLWCML